MNHLLRPFFSIFILIIVSCTTPPHTTEAKAKKPNIILKIRKGQPVGCFVVITNLKMYKFLFYLLVKIFPLIKDFKGIPLNFKNKQINTLSFYIYDLTVFKELNTHFYFYNKLPPLNITIVTNTTKKNEFIFLLNSFKIPLIIK